MSSEAAGQVEVGVGRASIRPWPTPTGVTLIAAIGLSFLIGRGSLVAIGALLPLVAAAAVDAALSTRELNRRPVSISPVRTMVNSPARLRFLASAPAGKHRIYLFLKSLSLLDPDLVPVAVPKDGSTLEVEIADGMAQYETVVRYRVAVSILGLCWARRWEARQVPALHRGPAPSDDDVVPPAARDEVSRLRPYLPGDRLSRVSWGATARTGDLHVRSDGDGDNEVTVVLDLGSNISEMSKDRKVLDPYTGKPVRPLPIAQVGLERAAQVVTSLMEDGYEVRLLSVEIDDTFYDRLRNHFLDAPQRQPKPFLLVQADGVATIDGRQVSRFVDRTVFDADELTRRLARADYSAPVPRPPGAYIEVTPQGVNWVQG